MSEFTEKDIPISCGECGTYYVGLEEMIRHIAHSHQNYGQEEAEIYAKLWMEDAFADVEKQQEEYSIRMKEQGGEGALERAIEADMDHQRHNL